MALMWLSFCDDEKPKGSQFLGVIIIKASDVVDAVAKSHFLGINPGGEILAYELSDEASAEIPENFRNRLLSKDELKKALRTERRGTCRSR